MEIKINDYQLPAPITFNFAELKNELVTVLNNYANMVYSDEAIKEAKADRARLNKLSKALNDERIKREREYMQPFGAFKAQIAELVADINGACTKIDAQIKACEERQRAEKRERIDELMKSFDFCGVSPTAIFSEKWLNASVSLSSIEKELTIISEEIRGKMEIIGRTEFPFEAREVFIKTGNLSMAIAESQRLIDVEARKRAAQEAAPAPTVPEAPTAQPKEEPRTWIGFKARLSVAEARALAGWLKQNKIEYTSMTIKEA